LTGDASHTDNHPLWLTRWLRSSLPVVSVSRARWFAASAIWTIGGFAFPLLTPATTFLSEGLQPYVIAAAGMSAELAYYVAFTLCRVPLTAVLGMLAAAVQCTMVEDVRPLGRWVVAAGIASCVATLIWLPTSLVALQIAGGAFDETERLLLLMFGAGTLGGLVAFAHRRTGRAGAVPRWFVPTSALAAVIGVLGEARL
jgi:hypothetical protein